tara:strand:- start:112 stop:543 length:432 start_codon:yes stop_codon:yes gene_type:complete
MKFEPWVSFNLLFICITIGFLSLKSDSITTSIANKVELSTYLKVRHHLKNIYVITPLNNDESEVCRELQIINSSGQKQLLKILSTNSKTILLLDELVVLDNLKWAKINIHKNTKIPTLILQIQNRDSPLILSLQRKTTRHFNG